MKNKRITTTYRKALMDKTLPHGAKVLLACFFHDSPPQSKLPPMAHCSEVLGVKGVTVYRWMKALRTAGYIK